MTTAADLKRRWYEPENAGLRMAVLGWLREGGRRPAGLREIDGRVDLRGIPLTASPVTFGDKDDPGSGVRWEGLDLRLAQVDGLRFFAARIENCLFESASVMDLRPWGSEVVECSFRRAKVYGALGTGEWLGLRNVWRRVAFEGAKLSECAFTGCALHECSFEKNGRRLVLEDCEVVDCAFRGDFESLIITGRGHRSPVDDGAFSADFSQATFTDSHIVGYSLDRTRLPDQHDLIVIRGSQPVLVGAVQWLAEHATSEAEDTARSILERWTNPSGSDQTDLCFDLRGVDPAIGEAVRRSLAVALQ